MINSDRGNDPDRYLVLRNGVYVYRRRVPVEVRAITRCGRERRVSLRTKDIAKARGFRDYYEQGDDDSWALYLVGDEERALAVYESAVKQALAFGLTYKPTRQLLAETPDYELIGRLRLAMDNKKDQTVVQAALGTISSPDISVSKAYDFYLKKIAPNLLRGKSNEQKRAWLIPRNRAVANFVEVVGDIEISKITRAHATMFYEFWRQRIAPDTGRPSHSASSGNRDMGGMKMVFKDFHSYHGIDLPNPFDKLGFKEVAVSRPPFPVEWIISKILTPGALAKLNAEARAIVLIMIETGARPSEVTSLNNQTIVLSGVPHISIEPNNDMASPREIKTRSSVRKIPLVGVALAAARAHQNGFPRYLGKNDNLSAMLKKHFELHELFPTPQHKVYSFRHSFEDRMKEANLDAELRQILMGHHSTRPQYGAGGALEWRQEQMKKIVLPFDPSIV